ncbi:lytic transglycosylase domain-containing protein [Shewanella sp. YIC-542]|uniref:lytic murein transglycosylase n=1 Tax=Shewanella mytili TaxID=3377111 RepID=UPI00398F33EE
MKYWGALFAVLLLGISFVVHAQITNFSQYLSLLRQQALKDGIAPATVNAEFPQIKRFRRAEMADAPSGPRSLEQYLPASATELRVLAAKKHYLAHKAAFDALANQYQIPARFVLALWGGASDFGEHPARYPVLSVTASLAFAQQDVAVHRQNFMAALTLLDSGTHNVDQLRSDRNGLLGQARLSPVLYAQCATDGNGDGQANIWDDPEDVFASIAHCLQVLGWEQSQTWGRQVRVPATLDSALVGEEHKATFAQWQALGVTRFDGSALPKRQDMQVSLIMPDGTNGRHYLIYDNYRALKQLLYDDYVVLAVVHLSEKLKAQQID